MVFFSVPIHHYIYNIYLEVLRVKPVQCYSSLSNYCNNTMVNYDYTHDINDNCVRDNILDTIYKGAARNYKDRYEAKKDKPSDF